MLLILVVYMTNCKEYIDEPWTADGKSEEEIIEAFKCAKRDMLDTNAGTKLKLSRHILNV